MRVVVALVLASSAVAFAEPVEAPAAELDPPRVSAGVSTSILFERYLGLVTEVEATVRIADEVYVHGAAGFGTASHYDPAGSGQGDSSIYLAHAGVTRLRCSGVGCWGLRGSVGVERAMIERSDALVDPPMWTEIRQTGFGEVRALAQLRLGSHAALETALAGRVHASLGGTEDGLGLGLVVTAGLHLMR